MDSIVYTINYTQLTLSNHASKFSLLSDAFNMLGACSMMIKLLKKLAL